MSPNSLVWKRFWVIHLKFYRNCTFPQNLRTRKSGEITVFYAAEIFMKIQEHYLRDLILKKEVIEKMHEQQKTVPDKNKKTHHSRYIGRTYIAVSPKIIFFRVNLKTENSIYQNQQFQSNLQHKTSQITQKRFDIGNTKI